MEKYSDLKQNISRLIKDGEKLYVALDMQENNGQKSCKNLNYFILNYETWYTKSIVVIKQLSPERYADFTKLYSNEKRKELKHNTYCISDALRTTYNVSYHYGPWTAALCVLRQITMLQACLDRFDNKVYEIQTILQADIFDSEIESAKHLLKMGFFRAAGALCGVIIEKHFSDVCKSREIPLKKKTPTIADFNDALKDVAYDVVEWRKMQRLADIRNLCDHNKGREPTRDEVDELISGTERFIKTIF